MSEQTILHEGRFLRLIKTGTWEYVQRVRASGAVHIVAVTADRQLLLVEQHRVPVGQRVIELPAGIVGDEAGREAEGANKAAARELVEETGYQPARVERLYHGPSSPGLSSEVITLVRARDLDQVGPGGGVDGENITVLKVPLDDMPAWLRARVDEGRLIDHRVYAALYFLGVAEASSD
jgi:ADP-ribose pyrophosphatase